MTISVLQTNTVAPPAARLRPLQSMSRRALYSVLGKIREGRVVVEFDGQAQAFGRESADALQAIVRINDARHFTSLALGGSVGAGESYVEGWWDCDDVTAMVQILVRNLDALETLDSGLGALLRAPLRRLGYWLQRNTRDGSRKNIAAHYDLSNDFFRLFLDPTMTYSGGVFLTPDSTMEEASIEKLDRACRKLRLTSDDHLLEIGTGWGSLSMHAAREYGCRVTTTTISKNQAALARQRIDEAGLSDRVTVLERDYRDLDGQFDKIVSIEMIEAVGHDFHDEFFQTCSRLLKPDGLMLLQAITIRDQRYARAAKTRDWLKEHIFPGSCLLSVQRIQDCLTRSTDMKITHMEDIGPHYATTLARWRETFLDRESDVRALGFDDRFIRTWIYYLCYCEGVFRERHTGDVQALLAKPGNRDAMYMETGATA